jgi:hypothetical protein
MIVLAFFSWWYGRGWREAGHNLSKRINTVSRTFSVQLLLRTLFSPWRRIISYPGANLAAHIRAWGDNLVSRVIGFFVRLIVLIAAFVSSCIIIALTLVEIVVWPLLPPAIVACLVLGVIR